MKPERLISVHFPKAGGTSLATQLQKLLPDQVEVDYQHDPLSAAGHETAAFPAGKRVVHGHFRPGRFIGSKACLCTFLRDPVDNLLSIYFYWRYTPKHGNEVHDRFLAEQPDIIDFARFSVFSRLMSETYFGGFDMSRFDFIGFHETRTHDIAALGAFLELPLRSEVHENSTPPMAERDALRADSVVMREVRDILLDDTKFYEKMQQHAARR